MKKNIAVETFLEIWEEAFYTLRWVFLIFSLIVILSLLFLYSEREGQEESDVPGFESPKA
jgi:hypothetical protein